MRQMARSWLILINLKFIKIAIFALGVKLANSEVSEQKRINLDAILAIKNNAKSSFLKFVLSRFDKSELDEIYI